MISQKFGSRLNSGLQLESVGWNHLLHSHEALPELGQGPAITHARVSNSQKKPSNHTVLCPPSSVINADRMKQFQRCKVQRNLSVRIIYQRHLRSGLALV